MGSTTPTEVLNELRIAGYGCQLIAQTDGTARCTACETNSPASRIKIDGYRRLEGASDVADMSIIAWAGCPSCAEGGVLMLGYGPNASEADEAVIIDLDLKGADHPGSTPDEAP